MKKERKDISLEDLKKYLDYDPDTGIFRWKLPRGRAPKGAVAGVTRDDSYVLIGILGTHYYAHRLAWLYVTGEWPVKFIDHKNCNPNDNRIENLREATHAQNLQNRRASTCTGFKGVRPDKGKWMARINEKYIGVYNTPEEAHAAYLAAAKERYGEFAKG